MRNPFRDEAAAFRLVLLTIGYFALIVAAAAVSRWVGLAMFVVLTAFVVRRLMSAPTRPTSGAQRADVEDTPAEKPGVES
jgi:membrane protein implicated in regulation of membrane protease activity